MSGQKLIMVFLLVLLTGIFSGCVQPETEPVTIPTQETEGLIVPEGTWGCLLPEKEVPSASIDSWVIPAISKNYRWVDGVDGLNEVSIVLPHMDSGMKCAAAFNADIDSYAEEIITEVEECADGGYSTHITSVRYEAYLNGNTLSILIITETTTDDVNYDVYNFDIETDEALTDADMCKTYLDIPYPVFLKYTQDQILSHFEAEFPDYIAQFPEDFSFIKQLYLTNLSIIQHYQLYLDDSGALMLIADRPSLAGAAYYAALQEASVNPEKLPGTKESWQWLFDLYLGADLDNTEFARNILITAYEKDEESFTDALKQRPRNEQEAIEAAVSGKNNSKG